MSDPQFLGYGFWHAALAGKPEPFVDGSTPLGFFRFRDARDGEWYPLAIWRGGDGSMRWHRGPDLHTLPENDNFHRIISYAFKHPVTEENYRSWCRNRSWPDDVPKIGDNSAFGDEDDYARITREIAEHKLEIHVFLKTPITTQEQADKATHWAQKLAGLESERGKAFKDEKAPALAETQRIDIRWREPRDAIDKLRSELRAAQSPYLIEQKRLADKAAAEKKAAEQAAFLAGQENKPAPAPAVPSGSSGRSGRKTRVVDVYSAKILDFEKAMLAMKTHPELIAKVQELADRAYAKGLEIPGCEKVTTPTTVGG